jgi:ArsR family transcriptional regulator
MVKVPAKPSVDRIFKAFADRTRLRILNLLRIGPPRAAESRLPADSTGELCVCDLVRILRAPQPKISRHLAYLRKAGLVTGRKEGLWIFYALTPAGTEFHQRLLDCLSCCFRDVPELAKDARKLRAPFNGGSCREESCCE